MSYYERLETGAQKVYELAGKARERGLDASLEVEVPPAKDLAARIEGLVGPPGVAKRIRELKMERELVAKKIVDEIVDQKLGEYRTKEEMIEQAIRTSLALYTEGVVAAPIEGISRVEIVKDPEGSFLSVYYAGPIRSAGGSAQAFSVIVAEYIRERLGIAPFRPSRQEVERVLEEVNMYHERVARLQYNPSEEEVRNILANLKVCIDGDPTSEMEVSINKNIPRVNTNRIRGGICLVLCEGIAQKAAKLVKLAKKFSLDWSWLKKVKKAEKKEEKFVLVPSEKYLKDIVAGRPIVAHPSRPGAFRLRYGRARNTGIAAKAIHPATMILLDDFFAVGTQMKIERPGKGTVSMPCDSIEGPIVRLRNGDVVKVKSCEKAHEIKSDVEKILFLGDILVPYGDFKKTNHPLIPSPFVEEWWSVETGIENPPEDLNELVDFCDRNKLPLHPSALYYYNSLNLEELRELYELLKGAKREGKSVYLTEGKELLEKLGCEHKVRDGKLIIENAYALLRTVDTSRPFPKGDSVLAVLNKLAPFEIRDKAPVFIGARMGRPEKARERKMSPAPHVLFPVGDAGGKTRTIPKAAERDRIFLDIARYRCRKCGATSFLPYCQKCGSRTELVNVCSQCGHETKEESCPKCGAFTNSYDHIAVNLGEYLSSSERKLGVKSARNLKGVKGTVNHYRVCESIEKGILRANHNVFVFKDGTIRFDATDIPLTHFRPEEIEVDIEKIRELGYTKDCKGQDLTDPHQLIELKPQDIIVPLDGVEYLINTTRFLDDLLEKFYGLERYYNIEKKEDLVGHLVVGLAPHTSAGVLGRIIGFSPVNGLYAHPYFHAAKRRNCLSGNENIVLVNGSNLKNVNIKNYFDSVSEAKNLRVPSYDLKTGKSTLSKIKKIYRRNSPKHLLKIKTKSNRTITVTPEHRLFVLNEGVILTKRAVELKVGDKIAAPAKIGFEKKVRFDFTRYLSDSDMRDKLMLNLSRKDIQVIMSNHGGLSKTSKKLGITMKVLDNWRRRESIPLTIFQRLKGDSKKIRGVSLKRHRERIPFNLSLNEDLAELLGYYVAEGYSRKGMRHYQVCFAFGEKEIKNRIMKLCEKLFSVKPTVNNHILTLSGRLFYELFENYLKAGAGAHKKRVPTQIMNSDKRIMKRFLSAYFDGDGNINSRHVSCCSVSKTLLQDIEIMLLRFEIFPHWYEETRKITKGMVADFYKRKGKKIVSKAYYLRLYGKDFLNFYEKIGFNLKRKQRVLRRDIKKKNTKTFPKIGDLYFLPIKEIVPVKSGNKYVYDIEVEGTHSFITNGLLSHNCDGDEDSIMLLMDVLLNFSKMYLPESRGGRMDAPLVLTLAIDPKEVDDEVHEMEVVDKYPLELYKKSLEFANPSDVKVATVGDRLGSDRQDRDILFTHDCTSVNDGVIMSAYKKLKTMEEKVISQLQLATKIQAADAQDVASRVLNTHFLRDLYGNLRTFGRQQFRCVDCNSKYRRVPLVGKCTRCGGKIILTIARGSVEKYLDISRKVASKYGLSDYMKQRLELLKREMDEVFENEPTKQVTLDAYM